MKWRCTWPIEDTTLTDAELIAEAKADLPNVRPDGLVLRDQRWSIEGGHVCVIAQARKKVADCGTDAGYYRHKRTTMTPVCDACQEAHNEYEAARQAIRRANRPKRERRDQPVRKDCTECGGKHRRVKATICVPCEKRAAKAAQDAEDPERPFTWVRRGLVWVPVLHDEEAA